MFDAITTRRSRVGCARGLGVAIVVLAVGCDPSSRALFRPNVILVTIDTLRADHVSAHGYERDTTPFLRGLAERSVRFDGARSTSSWTATSLASLVTSRLPEAHGVLHGVTAQGGGVREQETLPAELTTIAEALQANGYATFAVSSNGHLVPEFGFAQGFDNFSYLKWEDAEKVNERVGRWRDALRSAQPHFLWVHYIDPHAPYERREPAFSEFYPEAPTEFRRLETIRVWKLGPHAAKGSSELAYVQALYDSEVRFVDSSIAQLFEMLGVTERDLVIVTSDHGEEFRDHGYWSHGHKLYDESIRVPMIMQLPNGRGAGVRIATPVSLVDVLPTIADVLGLPTPYPTDGRSLLSLLDGRQDDTPVYASLDRFEDWRSRAVMVGDWKYILPLTRRRVPQLYDLGSDAGERINLIEQHPDRAKELDALAAAIRQRAQQQAAAGAGERTPVSAQELEMLKSLGYVQDGSNDGP